VIGEVLVVAQTDIAGGVAIPAVSYPLAGDAVGNVGIGSSHQLLKFKRLGEEATISRAVFQFVAQKSLTDGLVILPLGAKTCLQF
jgi:hypothetical protein